MKKEKEIRELLKKYEDLIDGNLDVLGLVISTQSKRRAIIKREVLKWVLED